MADTNQARFRREIASAYRPVGPIGASYEWSGHYDSIETHFTSAGYLSGITAADEKTAIENWFSAGQSSATAPWHSV